MINEVDYDQVGADTGGFVEIANTGTAAATLDGTALVLVNGGDSTEYGRKTLTGTLAAGAKLVVDVDPQNGAPDGLALVDTTKDTLIDALSYEGAIHAATIGHQAVRPGRGNAASGRRRRLEHRRGIARADSRRDGHEQRSHRLVVHDDRDSGSGQREDGALERLSGGRVDTVARVSPEKAGETPRGCFFLSLSSACWPCLRR